MTLVLRAVLMAGLLLTTVAAERPPNIVILFADDLGWKDLGCYGGQLAATPHLDRLASQGVRFTDAYSACTVCSPSRAAMMTGQWPARLHITDWIHGHQRPFAKLSPPEWTQALPRSSMTIAEALAPAGYVSASIGKWHLGDDDGPEQHGFALNRGGTGKGQPPSYFAPYRIPTLPDGPAGEYLTDREAIEACRFIDANRDRPFLLYLPFHAVHTPLQAKPEKIAASREKLAAMKAAGKMVPTVDPVYAAMVESLDDAIGAVLTKLDETGLAERTLVFFTSDNGGLTLRGVTDNRPLRAGKGSAYEGGVRVPMIVRGPGVAKPGSVCHEPVITCDIFPTALAAAGVASSERIDGLDLTPLLRDPSAKLPREALYWHYPHYHPGGATPYSAMRQRDWRLVEFFEDGRAELYHLAEDGSETTDRAEREPARLAAMRTALQTWREQVGAQLPVKNPRHDPTKAERAK